MRRFLLGSVTAVLVLAPAMLGTAEATASTRAHAAARGAAVSWPVVRPGTRSERVWVIQFLLNQHGVRVAVDGVYGRATTAAVKTFQRSKRLTVDGVVGPATWQKLIVTIKRGSRGLAVRALQHQLRNQYGYRSVAVDGVFGPSTESAVKNFQSKRRLAADGIVGPATWKALQT
jgi:peptidoglycan hydrolase-like protein with peptidoglycan-binding domain